MSNAFPWQIATITLYLGSFASLLLGTYLIIVSMDAQRLGELFLCLVGYVGFARVGTRTAYAAGRRVREARRDA